MNLPKSLPIGTGSGKKPSILSKLIIMWKKPTITEKFEELFWHVLCPYPDQTKLGMWWYNISGKIASYFHIKHCDDCFQKTLKDNNLKPFYKAKYGFWMYQGHWCHAKFSIAINHLLHGGKIKIGRL